MSKAFLRESDDLHDPEMPAPVSPLPPGARNYLTAAGAKRLRDELKRLRTVDRPPLAARAPNDREAKTRLVALDQRIRYLQQSLLTADVVMLTSGPTDIVRFGATVAVDEGSAAPVPYRIVGVDEADPARNAVSWISPLAQALMNRRVGEHVELATPGGPKAMTIVAIRYETE